MSRREDILTAMYEAERLHRDFDSRARAEAGEGRIDVFGMFVARDVPVMFQPLTQLLGAFVDSPDRGVIITSKRPLPVQRFTAAHELGHEVLGHSASFDQEETLMRALFVPGGRHDPREVQANAFASRLLTPAWLIAHHMSRQGWTRDSLADPRTVYQLSLRMGSSYTATCYAIEQSGGINKQIRNGLLRTTPKSIKQSLLHPYERDAWYGDIWVVTERDHGLILDGSRSDMIVLKFEEHSGAGYLWDFDELAGVGLTIRDDHRASTSPEHVGGSVLRTVIAEPQDDGGSSGRVHFREARPWQSHDAIASLQIDLDLSGPVKAGLLPAQRETLLSVA